MPENEIYQNLPAAIQTQLQKAADLCVDNVNERSGYPRVAHFDIASVATKHPIFAGVCVAHITPAVLWGVMGLSPDDIAGINDMIAIAHAYQLFAEEGGEVDDIDVTDFLNIMFNARCHDAEPDSPLVGLSGGLMAHYLRGVFGADDIDDIDMSTMSRVFTEMGKVGVISWMPNSEAEVEMAGALDIVLQFGNMMALDEDAVDERLDDSWHDDFVSRCAHGIELMARY